MVDQKISTISNFLDQLIDEDNVKRIESEKVRPHLESLDNRLSQLSEVFIREEDEFVSHYISLIKKTIGCLILKHELSGYDQLDFSLTIDPTDSGFPTVKDFYLLEKDKIDSDEVLKILPEREEIIDNIRNRIMTRGSIENEQNQLRRQSFFSQLNRIKILEEYDIHDQIKGEKKDGRSSSILDWSCIERFTNVPVFYRLWFTQDRAGKQHGLDSFIYQTQYGIEDVKNFAQTIDRTFDDIHPKLLEKYTIGPFYNDQTKNSQEIKRVLHKSDPREGILKFSRESVLSAEVRGSRYTGFVSEFLYRLFPCKMFRSIVQREIYNPVEIERMMIVPFRTKQELGDYDETGKPCIVYGVTKGGRIVT